MAEPKPAAEKPNLVAVAPESKPEKATKPTPAATAAPVVGKATPAAPARAAEKQGTRWGLWLLVLLFAGAAATAWVQTQRLAQAETRVIALSEQVLGIEAQLSAAHTQISTYEMQRGQVREAVSDISQRVLMLGELVGGVTDSLSPPPEPAATP